MPWPTPLSGRGFKALHLYKEFGGFPESSVLTLTRQFELLGSSCKAWRTDCIIGDFCFAEYRLRSREDLASNFIGLRQAVAGAPASAWILDDDAALQQLLQIAKGCVGGALGQLGVFRRG